MSEPLDPQEIFRRSAKEGRRRLDQGMLALVSTGFIAGFSIVFGSAAQAVVHSLAEPHFGEAATILGALAFAIGVVFLILGRAELFSENFFDPVAAFFEKHGPDITQRLARLWIVTLALNLVGGAIFVVALSVGGVLSEAAQHSVISLAEQIAGRTWPPTFVRSILGGALVALLSFLIVASRSSGARMAAAFVVGFLLAVGPFEHIVVSVLHVFFGLVLGANITMLDVLHVGSIALIGNLLGGVGLVTLSHVAQAKGEEKD